MTGSSIDWFSSRMNGTDGVCILRKEEGFVCKVANSF